jgi:hypothetical protein
MVYFKKTDIEPLVLNSIRSSLGDYRHTDILFAIKADFYDKCYICEQKGISSINVEHFAPHKDIDMIRKYNWSNLFWACSHCNTIKSSNYDGKLLNCTIKEDNVDTKIRYMLNFNSINREEQIIIDNIDNSINTLNTVELLRKVYKGTTALNKHHSVLLRNKIYDEIFNFQCTLDKYLISEDEEKKEEIYLYSIKKELSNKSPFSAFKRDIVRYTPQYNIFIQYILP